MQKVKGVIPLFLLIMAVLIFSIPGVVLAQKPELDVRSAILMAADSGQILYTKNPEQKLPVGSINKIMTLLITLEQLEQGELKRETTITVSRYAESTGGSQIFLASGTQLTVEELLQAIAIASANDATVALAEGISDSEDEFVSLMNEKAKELDMDNTQFLNSTGLPAPDGQEQYTTVEDITLMSRALIKNFPEVLDLTSTWVEYLDVEGREVMLANTNKLINNYTGLDGLRTGYTEKAGYCLAATAVRDNLRLISVVLNADSKEGRRQATRKLLDYGFNRYENKILIEKDKEIQNIRVPRGKQEFTTARTDSELSLLIKKGESPRFTRKIRLKEDQQAPIEKGDTLAFWEVYQLEDEQESKGKKIGQVKLVATEDIDRAGLVISLWRRFQNWIKQLANQNKQAFRKHIPAL
ncbi:MAG: D-alanyl-D-alanine carboxypeptidase family protein [Bacillota bacterium]